MSGIWYRGEGVGVEPAEPGTVRNDIGDGMYLTDQLDVAKKYAFERASKPDDQRVYKINVDYGNMRILDLTTDVRWKNHIGYPTPDGTIEQQLQSGTASQYSQHFQNFLQANKIDLTQYDAVIGFEFRNGGRQMCVLYKNGEETPVQVHLRSQFVPVTSGKPVSKTPPGLLRFRGKIGPGVKYAGGTLASAAILFVIDWLLGKSIETQQSDSIKLQYEQLVPTIELAIKYKSLKALNLIFQNKKAYAVIQFSHNVVLMHMGPNAGWSASETIVEFEKVEIKDKEENGEDGVSRGNYLTPGSMIEHYYYKMSTEISFSQEEIDLYSAYRKEIEWYDRQFVLYGFDPDSKITDQEFARLKRERNALMDKLYDALEIPWILRTDFVNNWTFANPDL